LRWEWVRKTKDRAHEIGLTRSLSFGARSEEVTMPISREPKEWDLRVRSDSYGSRRRRRT